MTRQAAASPTVELSRLGWRDLGLWAVAAALVLGAHVAVAYAVQSFSPVDPADGGPPPALAIEMAPMVVTPAVREQAATLDAAVPDQAEPVEETEKAPEAEPEKVAEQTEPVAEPDAPPPDATEPTETMRTEPVDQPPLEEVVPDIAETVAPDVAVPLPQPVETPKEKKPVQAKVKKPVEKPKPKKNKAPPPKTVTAASAEAKPAARTAAPKSAAGAAGVSPAKWESRLLSWIKRHTRYPSAARSRRSQGNADVAFTVDASGRVTSARVVRSSGDPDLDRAALAVLQGATVPAPPPELGSRVSRTAPFVFSLRH
ncbi:energy transducer TonB [Mesorhizobium sp. BR1-1-9]|uniref:energy transducer TonB family protein n=1 Tax=unclassified Mesorhizobium TaxID=325217 RepID=UPI001129FB0B|nr:MULTISPECIES: energy transducer TonB [unclassified Mesorhizobium]MBZ9806695.1 energy transducer TonB [Mesorhizobium sp. ESP-6-2]MBZ9870555.1 energy transducer TonB [Mesorhizobium sp. BR1-1-9]MBZ9939888.1 energy transducer TonB [Mesorhizobium sp. BR1-1-13]TPM24534.1 energy transducer TonB [Mesorhizobium sp. B2-2-2]